MLRDVFTQIYIKNTWCSPQTRSGGGSEILRTQSVRENLVPLLHELGAQTMLDAGCGDWNWMSRIDFEKLQVLACDIVPAMIVANQKRFGDRAEFFEADITSDPLPRVDVILCRTVIFHLSFEHALQALRNFKRSGARYLLITQHPNQTVNEDIQDGMWRRLNLRLAPFHFPEPMEVIQDGEDAILGLWEAEHVAI